MNRELILKESRHWLSCEQEGMNINSNEKFIFWINKSNEHKKIFDKEKSFRNSILSLSKEHKDKLSKQTKQELKSEKAFNKLKILGSLAACLVIIFSLFLFKAEKETFKKIYITSNKIQEFNMPDNSKIILDAKSKIKVLFSDKKREVFLEEGKVVFDVVSNKNRPFIVKDKKIVVHVLGTKFEVEKKEKGTNISVIEGLVAVRYGENETSRLLARLQKGDIIDISRKGEIKTKKNEPFKKFAKWKDKKLVFTQTPLNEVIQQFLKYSNENTNIILNCDESYPITGEFGVYDLEKFLEYLPLIYPIKIKQETEKLKILENKKYICQYL